MKTEHVPMLCTAGDNDFLKVHGEKLIESCVDPFVIRHPKGHTVPRLDDKSLEVMLRFLEKIEKETSEHAYASTDVDEKEVCM